MHTIDSAPNGRPSEIEGINQRFYDELYRKRNPLLQIAHPLVSFDQQSKSKRNFRILKPFLGKRPYLSPPPAFLDYGFGHGSLLLKLPRSYRIFGCDLSPEAVANLGSVCRLLNRKMELFTVADFGKGTGNAEFDFIVCSHVLEHVPDDVATLRLLAGKLAPNGRILINLPINEVWEDPKHIRKYDAESIRSLLGDCGLGLAAFEEGDRWTGFFLKYEMVRPLPRPFGLLLRTLRFLFAITPMAVVEALERLLAGRFPPQQFLALAEKRN